MHRLHSLSLRVKLILLMLLIVAPLLLINIYIYYVIGGNAARNYDKNEVKKYLDLSALNEEKEFDKIKSVLLIASKNKILLSNKLDSSKKFLQELNNIMPEFRSIALLNNKGDILGTTNNFIHTILKKNGNIFKDLGRITGFTVDDIRIKHKSNYSTLYIIFPLFKNNKLKRRLVVFLDEIWFEKFEQKILKSLPPNVHLALVGKTQDLLASESKLSSKELQHWPSISLIDSFSKSGKVLNYLNNKGSITYFSAKSIFKDTLGHKIDLIIDMPQDSILIGTSKEIKVELFIVTFFVGGFLVLLLFWGNRNITEPFMKLSHAMQEASKGNYSVHTNISVPRGEISKLAIAFDKMIRKLDKYDKLQKQAEEELRLSERKYKQLFNDNLAAVFISDIQKGIIDCNAAYYKLLGYSSKEEIVTADPRDFYINPKDRIEFIQILKEQGEVKNYEMKMKRKDGSVVSVLENTALIITEEGTKTIHGTLIDISKIKEAENAMKEAKELAEKSDRLKSEFLAQMSHEIRTPLSSIMGFSSLLQQELIGKLDDDLIQGFDIFNSSGKRIYRTIDLILNMSEIKSGIYKPRYRFINIYDSIILPLFKEYKSIAEQKEIEFKIIKTTDLLTSSFDEYALTQIFRNLIDNAVKYTKKGKVEILIFKPQEKFLTVEIRDTGIGISEEFLPNIFNLFSQEKQGYTRPYDGNGLGLALVKGYADIIGAKLEFDSKKNAGTTFRVIFSI